MANSSPRRIQLACSGCGRLVSTDVWRVVDLGQKPDLKDRLLRGQLNVVTCPHCQRRTAVATPLAYHDPEKEMFYCVLPPELGLSGDEQNKVIGELTNLLMNSLPPEKRRAYLFQPQTLFSMERLREEILRAEGVTEQVRKTLLQRGELIQEFLSHSEDEGALEALVKEHESRMDYEFFLQLAAAIDQAGQGGDEPLAEKLTSLRVKLLDLTAASRKRPTEKVEAGMTREELIAELRAHSGDQDLKGLVAAARPLLDYQFFQVLTAQIDAAQEQGHQEEAEELRALRSRLLDLADELDREVKEALEKAAAVLRGIVESEDMQAAAEQNLDQIDGAFLAVLEANIAGAREAGQEQVADRLAELKTHVLALLEARLPPELVLLNRLLASGEAEERQRLLEERSDIVTEPFLKLLKEVAEDLRQQGHQAAERLEATIGQVEAMVQARNADASAGQSAIT